VPGQTDVHRSAGNSTSNADAISSANNTQSRSPVAYIFSPHLLISVSAGVHVDCFRQVCAVYSYFVYPFLFRYFFIVLPHIFS